jgi:hypothetical protein
MNQKDKRQLETQLVAMGLAGLQRNGDPSPELVQQMAGIVNSWQGSPNRLGEWIGKHEFLRDLLNECDRDKRQDMYEAIRPFLKFKVKAFNHYELMRARKADSGWRSQDSDYHARERDSWVVHVEMPSVRTD